MTTTNDGPCRFALFWLPFSGAPNEARRPYSYMTVRQDPEMGSLAAVSDSNQTWIQYTPNAGAVGEDKFSFRLMPGSGIYDVTVKVSAARQPTPSPEPNPASLFVYFDLDKADLSPNTLLALDGVGRQMQDLQFRDFVLQIAGHADARGSDEYNVALSERRAEAVRAYLMRRYAISPSRVRAAAFGDKILIDKANPFADDNRRVHLTLVRGLRASAAVNP